MFMGNDLIYVLQLVDDNIIRFRKYSFQSLIEFSNLSLTLELLCIFKTCCVMYDNLFHGVSE